MAQPAATTQGDERRLARIVVVGVGGAGINALNRMIEADVRGVDMVAISTDYPTLERSRADTKLAIGTDRLGGRGAGGDPSVGYAAAYEHRSDIKRILEGADMVFIAAGMGGGTGTGASPVVAEVAQILGALTIGVVTRPFSFEGGRRARVAEQGIDELKARADTVLAVCNDRLLDLDVANMPLTEAFRRADDVLRQGVQGISDIVTVPGFVNRDFSDVCATLRRAGTALFGMGEAEGEDRAVRAATAAISSPLLQTPINGALRVLINLTSGPELQLAEASAASSMICDLCDRNEAQILFGWVMDESMRGKVRVTVIAAGFPEASQQPAATVEDRVPQPQPVRQTRPHYAPPQTAEPPRDEPQPAPVSVQTLLAMDTEGPIEATDSTSEDDLRIPTIYRRR